MAKSNTGKYIVLGAAAVAVVYLVTRKQTTQVQPPSNPYVAQQQLQQWAQTQSNPNVLQSVIANLSLDDVLDFWDRIFGKNGSQTTTDQYADGDSDDGYVYI